MSNADADLYNLGQILSGQLTLPHVTELVAQFQRGHDLLVDGKCGPATLSRLEQLMTPGAPPDGDWPEWEGPIDELPMRRPHYYKIFGNPGSATLNPRWYAEHIIELHQDHGNELPFAPANQYIHLHELAEPYAREGLRRAQLSCPGFAIERLGSFNFRRRQHDIRRPLSKHAFGVALDVNPRDNRAVRFDDYRIKPKPWSAEWYAIWPEVTAVPEPFVQAMSSCGWHWGGWWREPCDPMHFELRGRRDS